ncbi:MAG: OmpH family outer membrane protein [Kiritimatiellae bacterium]|nr:OmpH family outer membrane protein [Kiritimatiellia bacterium]
MKKLILFTALAAATTVFADLKIGTVDMMSLVRNHSSYEPNKKLLTETEKDYTKKLDAMKAELDEIQEEGKNMTDQLRNPLLSQGSKTKLEKDLMDIQNKFITAQQRIRAEMLRSQQDLQELEGRLLKATTEDLREKINAFAAANKYDLIVDITAAPFASEKLDVTPAILKSMGVDPENTVEKLAERKAAEKTAAEKKEEK